MSGRWKLLVQVLGFLAGLVCAVYFVRTGLSQLDFAVVRGMATNRLFLVSLPLAVALYSSTQVITGLTWGLMIKEAGYHLGWRESVAITLSTQLAKYVPGNVAHILGRLALAVRAGVPAHTAALVSLLEMMGLLLAGTVVTVLFVCLQLESTAQLPLPPPQRLLAFLGIGLTVVLVIFLGRGFLGRWLPDGKVVSIPWRALTLSITTYLVAFCIHGLTLQIVGWSLTGTSHLLPGILVFTVAWISGFVTPGAPAGVGVRETVMLLGLTPLYGEKQAILLTIAMRLVSLLGDLTSFGIAGVLYRFHLASRASVESTTPESVTEDTETTATPTNRHTSSPDG